MASIGELVISLRADIANFRAGMDQANSKLDGLKQHSSEAAGALSSLSKTIEGFVSVEAIRRLADFSAELVESAARAGHLAEALGISAGTYQALAFSAQLAGVPTDAFANSMDRLQKNIEMLATGEKNAREVFAALGLSATNADGSVRSVADTLQDLAHDKIFLAENAATQLGQVMTITGAKSADAALLVNMLKNNLGDLAEMYKKAQADGTAFSEETIKDAQDIAKRVSSAWQEVKVSIGTAVVFAVEHPLDFLMNPMAGMEGGSPAGGQQGAPDARKPAGPPIADTSKAKEIASFAQDYDKLLANYRMDLDYQAQLRTAYTEGGAAVRQLQVDHAGELAVYKLLDEAESKHVTISDQALEAARKLAEANESAKLAASEQKTITDALNASMKSQDAAMQALVQSADLLTPKEQKLADTEGLLWQALDRGLISMDQFKEKTQALITEFNGADKGVKEFSSGFSSGVSSLIGKVTDFNTLISNSKRGQSIFEQLSQDGAEFAKTLQDLLLKLLVINPLLNSLGLGDQGNGKQLPTLWGLTGGGSSGGGFLGGLFSKIFGGADASAAIPAAADSSALDLGAIDTSGSIFADASLLGFANGGDFVVGGDGGIDTSLVAFKATRGERVSVGDGGDRGAVHHHYSMPITVVTPDANSFRQAQPQIVADGIRHLKAGTRYSK